MSKRRPSLPKNPRPGEQYSPLYHDVGNSPAWRVLPPSAVKLWVDMRLKLNGVNNGNIEATLQDMKHRGWRSSATLSKALRQLEHMGFIAKTRQGGIGAMSKVCSLYRFTDLPVFEHPKQGVPAMTASLDWKRFDSVKAAKAHLQAMPAGEKAGRCNKSKVQKLKLKGSKTEAMKAAIDSEIEQGASSKVQKLNKGKPAQTRAIAGGALN